MDTSEPGIGIAAEKLHANLSICELRNILNEQNLAMRTKDDRNRFAGTIASTVEHLNTTRYEVFFTVDRLKERQGQLVNYDKQFPSIYFRDKQTFEAFRIGVEDVVEGNDTRFRSPIISVQPVTHCFFVERSRVGDIILYQSEGAPEDIPVNTTYQTQHQIMKSYPKEVPLGEIYAKYNHPIEVLVEDTDGIQIPAGKPFHIGGGIDNTFETSIIENGRSQNWTFDLTRPSTLKKLFFTRFYPW